MTHIRSIVTLILSSAVPLCAFFAFAQPAHAFLDEIVELRQELALWEEQNSANFDDVLSQLDDIVSPVFRDVAMNDWFNAYVASLAEWNIVSGYRDTSGKQTGEFRPSSHVTIAEMLKMSFKAAKKDERTCGAVKYHPESKDHWARSFVACAEAMNARLFLPTVSIGLDRPAARAEVLAIIHDAFQEQVLPLYSNFVDTAGHPFESDIAHAAFNGVVTGDRDSKGNLMGTFRPNDPVNRAEAAKIIYEELKLKTAKEMGI